MINRAVLGALTLVAGACLSMVGTFLQLYRVTYDFGRGGEVGAPPPFEMSFTSWKSEVTPSSQLSVESDVPQFGNPVVFAALLLLVCAVALLREASGSPRVVAVARFTSVGAAMLLVGSVWSVGQFLGPQVRRSTPDSPLIADVGPGLWSS